MNDLDDKLADVRQRIDALDRHILNLLHERSGLVSEVISIKATVGAESYQKARFDGLLAKLKAEARTLGLDVQLVDDIWNAIHQSSMNQQNASKRK